MNKQRVHLQRTLRLPAVLVLVAVLSVTTWSLALAAPYHVGREDLVPVTILGAKCDVLTGDIPLLNATSEFKPFTLCGPMVTTADRENGPWAQIFYIYNHTCPGTLVGVQWREVDGELHSHLEDTNENLWPVYAGSTHRYELRQNGSTGVWSFYWGGNLFRTSAGTDTQWTGVIAQYFGEVSPFPYVGLYGSPTRKVRFSNFSVFLRPQNTWMARWPGTLVNDNPFDWSVSSSQPDYFDIWDLTP